ncbi:class I SAM-dependent methyltransferase [Methylobrevis pamukkalensis]|uniref:dTDP-3-amino-3,6-dideoxy-alpha-D-glucopyranose N,N-dimethyltransferase n=1 Tax=Methylobrevis pamukkalensis TaxID=1439726 RepID=A0A1E3GYF4_9HYPH|nr:class I SAM-dependent methyltransferase [Methylobrevis pamukkalensis]ODN69072.1 dTDP-3-amino-3,6-dideoxy-alpha-D-glucopyranose N,N-dimethyltransferase [Methylobrevis pamukkalensis]
MEDIRHGHRTVYETHARRWDRERSRRLFEKPWLDRLLQHVPAGGDVLDLGCGAGEPIARYLIEQGRRVTGIDFAAGMLDLARSRFPGEIWIAGDMRALDLGRRFSGIVAWNSSFHLSRNEQRQLLPRLGRHLLPGGALLMTVGPAEGEALGHVGDGTVYHASLSPAEFEERLAAAGLLVESFVANDLACAGHSVVLARMTA